HPPEDVEVEEGQYPRLRAAVGGRHAHLLSFDVLLRHRPRSISRGKKGDSWERRRPHGQKAALPARGPWDGQRPLPASCQPTCLEVPHRQVKDRLPPVDPPTPAPISKNAGVNAPKRGRVRN